jgi:hypothetical protein
LTKTRSKTLAKATHGAPTPNKESGMEGAPPAKSDVLSSKAKLMAELVTEQKWAYILNMKLFKKLNNNVMSEFQPAITALDRLIVNK